MPASNKHYRASKKDIDRRAKKLHTQWGDAPYGAQIDANQDAMNHLLEDIKPYVDNMLISRAIPNDREDISQKVLMSVAQRFFSYNGESSFLNWVAGIAANANIDNFRRIKSGKSVQLSTDIAPQGDGMCGSILEYGVTGHRQSTPLENVILAETAELLDNGIETMRQGHPELASTLKDRACGDSYQEVADKQGIPLGTVRSRVNSARNRLREILEDQGIDIPPSDRGRG